MAKGFVIGFVTVSSREEAEKIAQTLVEEHLTACCNIISSVESIYWWEDKVAKDTELLIILKSRRTLIQKIMKRVKEIHSYEVPEIIFARVIGGYPPYLKWVKESTKSPRKKAKGNII